MHLENSEYKKWLLIKTAQKIDWTICFKPKFLNLFFLSKILLYF
jgi:hypothetical protein